MLVFSKFLVILPKYRILDGSPFCKLLGFFMTKTPTEPTKEAPKAEQSKPLTLEDIVTLANKIGLEYAESKRKAEYYELMKPTERARLMEKHDNGKLTETKIRRLAETDPEYIAFLESLSKAKFECEQLKIRYESYKNLFEARRSMLSYKKAEMNLI